MTDSALITALKNSMNQRVLLSLPAYNELKEKIQLSIGTNAVVEIGETFQIGNLIIGQEREAVVPPHHKTGPSVECWENPGVSTQMHSEMLRLRSSLMVRIEAYLAEKNWCDMRICAELNIDRARLRKFRKGPAHYSLDGLVEILTLLNMRVLPTYVRIDKKPSI